ncbi:DUF2732 family protein [Enterobacter hormaechei]|uniref:DUF2732 family protein n=1 Tax=Enterobacter hormaechei TaxID=158836 RepID=UPI0005380B26|nr:DUF2732 family protein [Enterobacter hormaechei]KJL54465.1 hypothetical protein SS19_11615 [Enterobacter hormaechei subsp. steigerwaltii]EIY1158560.1 DUF2732 family protein [Enterobacter hormaechei]EKL0727853.1 DUF2732 family protein [Enterobacter hormaechei]EKS6628105.1 DUF2732 family protein [Enterobacter hormaechei]
MQKELRKKFVAETDSLMAVIDIAKREERKGRALAVSIRLEALATHITNKGFPLRTAAANAALMRPAITAQNKPPIADGAKAQ